MLIWFIYVTLPTAVQKSILLWGIQLAGAFPMLLWHRHLLNTTETGTFIIKQNLTDLPETVPEKKLTLKVLPRPGGRNIYHHTESYTISCDLKNKGLWPIKNAREMRSEERRWMKWDWRDKVTHELNFFHAILFPSPDAYFPHHYNISHQSPVPTEGRKNTQVGFLSNFRTTALLQSWRLNWILL